MRELAGPARLPAGTEYLWAWFRELNAARGSSGFGPNPLAYTEIAAWARLTGRAPAVWEVRWLIALDHVWLAGEAKG